MYGLALQEDTITEQLDAGVRYFDLRIARKPNDTDPKRLYFYHGLYTRTDVEVKTEMSYIIRTTLPHFTMQMCINN